jgi:hypothetical protein
MSRARILARFGKNTSINDDLNVGIVTATSFIGNGSGIAGVTTATVAQGLTGTPNISVGVSTVTSKLDVTAQSVSSITSVAALNIDCSLGNFFTKSINGNSTFTVSNVPSSRAYSFTLELVHTSGSITWFSGVIWPNGTAPTLTTGKTHLFIFLTDDGGTTWRSSSLINYAS